MSKLSSYVSSEWQCEICDSIVKHESLDAPWGWTNLDVGQFVSYGWTKGYNCEKTYKALWYQEYLMCKECSIQITRARMPKPLLKTIWNKIMKQSQKDSERE